MSAATQATKTTPTRRQRVMAWLGDHDGVCLWQIPGPKYTQIRHIECWRVGVRVLLIQFYEPDGFDLFTAESSNDIREAFTDAEKRLGLEKSDD
jgi:hypothetical protein